VECEESAVGLVLQTMSTTRITEPGGPGGRGEGDTHRPATRSKRDGEEMGKRAYEMKREKHIFAETPMCVASYMFAKLIDCSSNWAAQTARPASMRVPATQRAG